MERKDVIKAAEALKLDIKKNWKTENILKMVNERLVIINLKEEKKEKTFCGVSPLTGEKIYK